MERSRGTVSAQKKWRAFGWLLLLVVTVTGVGLAVYYFTPLGDKVDNKLTGVKKDKKTVLKNEEVSLRSGSKTHTPSFDSKPQSTPGLVLEDKTQNSVNVPELPAQEHESVKLPTVFNDKERDEGLKNPESPKELQNILKRDVNPEVLTENESEKSEKGDNSTPNENPEDQFDETVPNVEQENVVVPKVDPEVVSNPVEEPEAAVTTPVLDPEAVVNPVTEKPEDVVTNPTVEQPENVTAPTVEEPNVVNPVTEQPEPVVPTPTVEEPNVLNPVVPEQPEPAPRKQLKPEVVPTKLDNNEVETKKDDKTTPVVEVKNKRNNGNAGNKKDKKSKNNRSRR